MAQVPVAQVARPYGAGEPAAAGEISIVSTINHKNKVRRKIRAFEIIFLIAPYLTVGALFRVGFLFDEAHVFFMVRIIS